MADDVEVVYRLLKRESEDLNFVYNLMKCENNDCVNYLIPPLLQCISGHSFCPYCIWKETCPVCNSKMISTRSLVLEDVISAVLVSCKNKELGCAELFPPFSVEEHEDQCIYKYVKCIHNECIWRGERRSLWRHLTEVHPQDMLHSNQLRIAVPIDTAFTYHKILMVNETYFLVKIVYDTFSEKVFGAVRQATGTIVRGATYTFTVSSSKFKGKTSYQYEREVHPTFKRFAYIFRSEDCLVLAREFIAGFFKKEKTAFSLHLLIKYNKK